MLDDLFSPTAAGIARVALPVPVDQLFDYAIPPAQAAKVGIGHRVRVPFESRVLTGVIVELAAQPSRGARGRLRSIERVVDSEPVLSASLITILGEEAKAVLCPIGTALAAAIPAGSAPRTLRGVGLTPRGRDALRLGAVTGDALRLLQLLEDGPLAPQTLRHRAGAAATALPLLEKDRLVAAEVLERGPRVRAARVRIASVRPA